MKERIEELVEKYQKKLNYREERLEKSKKEHWNIGMKYENGEISYDKFFEFERRLAEQQDLYNMLYEIVKDLKELR